MTKSKKWAGLLLVSFFALTSIAWAKTALTNIPLVWRPTTTFGAGNHAIETPSRKTIRVETFIDSRENPTLIAENREDADEGKILPVTTRDDVAAWSADRLGYLLRQAGFDVVTVGGDIVLSGDVRRFFVTETSTYKGEVGIKIDLRTNQGKSLWSGLVTGSAKRFGRSYSAENYYEVISDSFIDAAQQLVGSETFARTVADQASP